MSAAIGEVGPRPLLCLPFAGGGASAFHGLRMAAPDDVTVRGVQLPGRESRFSEPSLSDWNAVDAFLRDEVVPELTPDTVVYGQSMGALLGHRLCVVCARDGVLVAGLCVAAHGGPDAVDDFGAHKMSGEELLAEMTSNLLLRGLPADFVKDVFLPTSRADFHLCETYAPDPAEVLDIPVLALTGTLDDAVTSADVQQWAGWTRGGFGSAVVEGDHFFVRDNPAGVLEVMNPWLGSLVVHRPAAVRPTPPS